MTNELYNRLSGLKYVIGTLQTRLRKEKGATEIIDKMAQLQMHLNKYMKEEGVPA